MSPEQKLLVQITYERLAPLADSAGELFYQRLFELDPSLKPLFMGDMKEQGKMFMSMIGIAVNGLDRVGDLLPVVEDLGHGHAGYGVKDKDYDTVGAAFIWTLERVLGHHFTPEARLAWTAAYQMLARAMKQAAAAAA